MNLTKVTYRILFRELSLSSTVIVNIAFLKLVVEVTVRSTMSILLKSVYKRQLL